MGLNMVRYTGQEKSGSNMDQRRKNDDFLKIYSDLT
jgi:hypothetical protein